jgi:hypothetical protein
VRGKREERDRITNTLRSGTLAIHSVMIAEEGEERFLRRGIRNKMQEVMRAIGKQCEKVHLDK